MDNETAFDNELYAGKETARPVFVSYPLGAEPSERFPTGLMPGFRTESPSPKVAREFHPDGIITGYADGGVYDKAAATRDISAATAKEEKPKAPAKPKAPKKGTKAEEKAKLEETDSLAPDAVIETVPETVTENLPAPDDENEPAPDVI